MRPALLACALLLFSRPTEARKTVVADLIFHNGTIHTLDADFSTAEALAVKDGRILAVGAPSEIGVDAASRYRVAWRDEHGETHEQIGRAHV